MQQLKVITDLSVLPKQIESNYEAVKAELEASLEKYDGLVVTDENIVEMKNTRAEINKGIAIIKQCGTETKSKLLAPFLPFDEKVKELVKLAEEKSTALDVQIKEIEARKRAEREKKYRDYAAEAAAKVLKDDLFTSSPYVTGLVDRNPKWMNASTSEKSVKREIDAFMAACAETIANVRTKYAGDYEVIKVKAEKFIVDPTVNFDYGRVIDKVDTFKKEQEELAEAQRRDEERRRAEETAREEARKAKEKADADARARRAAQVSGGQGAPVSAVRPSAAPTQPAATPEKPAETHELPPTGPSAEAPAPKASAASVDSLKPTVYKMVLEINTSYANLKKLREWLDGEKITFKRIGEIVKI